MRRTFQIALLLVAFIPFALGTTTLLIGAERFLSPDVVNANIDSQMRFSAVWSMLPFLLTLWIVRNLEQAGPILIIILSATAFAGIARVFSATQYGLPAPAMAGIIAFEISVLLFIPWYWAVMRKSEQGDPA